MRVKRVYLCVAMAMALVSIYAVSGQEPKLPVPPARVSDDWAPPKLKLSVEFVGDKVVDLRGKEVSFTREWGTDKMVGKVSPKMNAPLPVKVRFEKLHGKELKLSTRDYAFALLNDKGGVVERELGLGFTFNSDPKTGQPADKVAGEIVVGDKPTTHDPQLSLWRGIDNKVEHTRVKPGRYTLVVSIHGQIATVSFNVLGD